MLRRDARAVFVESDRGFFRRKRYYRFRTAQFAAESEFKEDVYQGLMKAQETAPVLVFPRPDTPDAKRDDVGRKRWWLFGGEFYWEDDGYSELEVKALVLERLRKKERRLQRAISLLELDGDGSSNHRPSISDEVKVLVWRRDGGSCVRCGSQENLEFDHIIPLSKGGSNTARNLQILCETCNRAKADSLV